MLEKRFLTPKAGVSNFFRLFLSPQSNFLSIFLLLLLLLLSTKDK